MGTRSLTHIRGEDNQGVILTIYRQFDGYPSGMGADLKDFVGNIELTNGFQSDQKLPNFANGMGCLAAYVVGKLKGETIGNIYIEPVGASDCGEEYVYTLYRVGDHVNLKVESAGWRETGRMVGNRYVPHKKPSVHPAVTLYDGLAADFDPKACEREAAA